MQQPSDLAPFILATFDKRYDQDYQLSTSGRKYSWMLFYLPESRAQWTDPAGKHHLITPQTPLLTWRNRRGPLELPPGSRVLTIIFDIFLRERIPHPEIGWRPVAGTTQPGPRKLFNRMLPYVLQHQRMATDTIEVMRRICVRWWRSTDDQIICNLLLAGWFGRLLDTYWHEADDHDPLRRAERYARQAISDGCTVEDMAKYLGMHPATFGHQYAQARGENPGEFLLRIKMERATELLQGHSDSIITIAEECGYRNRASFSRAFHHYYGLSPSDYRKSYHQR